MRPDPASAAGNMSKTLGQRMDYFKLSIRCSRQCRMTALRAMQSSRLRSEIPDISGPVLTLINASGCVDGIIPIPPSGENSIFVGWAGQSRCLQSFCVTTGSPARALDNASALKTNALLVSAAHPSLTRPATAIRISVTSAHKHLHRRFNELCFH